MTRSRRRFAAPEVIQTSAMDCGPAALCSLLAGFAVDADLARLRDACQSDLDGTSIDTLEEVARACGLDAKQVMLPLDHLFCGPRDPLPAIAVLREGQHGTHFAVLWRRVGRYVQVMDPAQGRLWKRASVLERQLHIHAQEIPAADYVAWFTGAESQSIQRERLRRLGGPPAAAAALLAEVAAKGSPMRIARFDAALRMVAELGAARAIPAGRRALELVRSVTLDDRIAIPERHHAVVAGPGDTVVLRGVVLVRVKEGRGVPARGPVDSRSVADSLGSAQASRPGKTVSPMGEIWRIARQGSRAALVGIAILVLVSSAALLLETIALRGLLALSSELGTRELRLAAFAVLAALVVVLFVLEVSARSLVVGFGRRLEVVLRTRFLERLPLLPDRYFRTRLASDFAQRAHAAHRLREVPELLMVLGRALTDIVLLGVALILLVPDGAWLIGLSLLAALVVPVLYQDRLRDLDMRARALSATINQFFLDAFLGAAPIRAHSAQTAMNAEHEELLTRWAGACRAFNSARLIADAVIYFIAAAPLVFVLVRAFAGRPPNGSELLLVYWATILPERAALAAHVLVAYPAARNVAVRLAEPLVSAEDPVFSAHVVDDQTATPPATAGVALTFDRVDVELGGRRILGGIELDIAAGAHVAVVGHSGAGKSSLLALLMGWQEPLRGEIRVDGKPLTRAEVARLRQTTAWIEPGVHLWSDTLLANVVYGAPRGADAALSAAIQRAEIHEVLLTRPEGLQSPVGESGRLLSGGQGQRVRIARGLMREAARLVLLDEPFRGLDADARTRLAVAVRQRWRSATLLYVTHDIAHALQFDSVLVIESGRLVERGRPNQLACDPSSRFAQLLAAESEARARLWGAAAWRRLHVDARELREAHRE
jgi:ABC-type bacteriocin/lantibiotic exporter with double-glycine peptidase domain